MLSFIKFAVGRIYLIQVMPCSSYSTFSKQTQRELLFLICVMSIHDCKVILTSGTTSNRLDTLPSPRVPLTPFQEDTPVGTSRTFPGPWVFYTTGLN